MNKVISNETKLKILKYAEIILSEHAATAGNRCCQDWSVGSEEIDPPEVGFTDIEKKDIAFNYQQWNSDGQDYDPEFLGFGDEMVVSLMLSRAINIMIEDLNINAIKE